MTAVKRKRAIAENLEHTLSRLLDKGKAQPVSADVEAMAEYLIHGEFRPEVGLWVSLPAKNAQAAAMLRSLDAENVRNIRNTIPLISKLQAERDEARARILELLEANGQLAVTLDECQALVAECRAVLKQ